MPTTTPAEDHRARITFARVGHLLADAYRSSSQGAHQSYLAHSFAAALAIGIQFHAEQPAIADALIDSMRGGVPDTEGMDELIRVALDTYRAHADCLA